MTPDERPRAAADKVCSRALRCNAWWQRAARVRSIEAFPVSCRLPVPVGDGQGLQPMRQSIFVRVTTEDGAYGWGEGGPPVPGRLPRAHEGG